MPFISKFERQRSVDFHELQADQDGRLNVNSSHKFVCLNILYLVGGTLKIWEEFRGVAILKEASHWGRL